MKISGYRTREIAVADSSAVAFDLDMEVTSTTGEAAFGISGLLGAHYKTAAFVFKSGRIFDPEGRNVYSYLKNKNINLKGTFLILLDCSKIIQALIYNIRKNIKLV